ncbi:uncharacterized protein LACBIDRAFT_327416 [Laccaria bicolor S238N-H82]|uniref:Predicted protein n=1 Tax=Laccaria bicolor (strain S238N-H82 / ATCC MYA-4686) TaxID=486041 RepID=B0DB04_LACBS|nr:uncharacterized protein LACBIDRAFT_327416 [Laccaria bicolor S238N-H82]EDR08299.1 predicted protein [Laccaria bicolor S238N-H82]|eukprot:XP_001881369.1 predicted protein [Laccaria bicolor S238N-H82]
MQYCHDRSGSTPIDRQKSGRPTPAHRIHWPAAILGGDLARGSWRWAHVPSRHQPRLTTSTDYSLSSQPNNVGLKRLSQQTSTSSLQVRVREPDLMSVLPWHGPTSPICSPNPSPSQSSATIWSPNIIHRNQTIRPLLQPDGMSVAGRQRISWRILEPGNTHGAATVVISFDPTSPGELSGRASSYGSPDCYGREHYDDSDTKWLLNQRDCACANGRFAHADFTICPQWWFSKMAHLTFVLRRPLEQDINKHPLSWLWWDVQPRHFNPVEGSAFQDLGTLDEKITGIMRSEAKKLHSQVAELARTKDPKICGGLFFVANRMRDASGCLSLTTFYYQDLVWHVASFQRLYMETLAMVDWFKTWEARLLEPNRQACQSHFEGFLGAEDPKLVVTEPQSGSSSVEPGTGPSRTDREVLRASPYSNPASSSTKASGSMSGACVNRDKFREIEEAFIPPQSPVWKKALQNVNPDPSRIKSSKDRVCGYQFPDPWLFMKGTNRKAFTLAWLISRSQWLQSFTSVDYSLSPAPHTQHWRDFLYHFSKEMNLVHGSRAEDLPTSQQGKKGKTPAKGGRKSEKSKQNYAIKRGESLKNAQTTFFGPRVKLGERLHSIFWRDVLVMEGNTDNLMLVITAEILWNLFEQNFRLELRMVDQQVLPANWASQESAAVRDELVRRTFPEDDDGLFNPPK